MNLCESLKIDQDSIKHFVLSILKPFKFNLTLMGLASLLWASCISGKAYFLKKTLNAVHHGNGEELVTALWQLWAMYLCITMSFRIYNFAATLKTFPYVRMAVVHKCFSFALDKDHVFYQNHLSGALNNKINDASQSITEILEIVFHRFLGHFLALILAIITLWLLNPIYALLTSLWSGACLILGLFISKRLHVLSSRHGELYSQTIGRNMDSLANHLSVRLFAAAPLEAIRARKDSQATLEAELQANRTYYFFGTFYGVSFSILQATNLYFLWCDLGVGAISVGDFALVLTLSSSLVDFLWHFADDIVRIGRCRGKISQALETLMTPPTITDSLTANPLNVTQGAISFKHVTFRHYNDQSNFFSDFCLDIKPGEKVGFVGYSGAGKTTCVNLLLRLFDPQEGCIEIDGQNIRDISQASLRRSISFIPQEPMLFYRSIVDNITYGSQEVAQADIDAACQSAEAYNFIQNLPQGYETLVGERGARLSGGQRQRLALARAFVKKAPILILDEATSQLDSMTEESIQKTLKILMKGKTCVVIAHRLSTLLDMDRIVVFEGCRIVQSGIHSHLMKEQGLYRQLWGAQVGGFLPDQVGQD